MSNAATVKAPAAVSLKPKSRLEADNEDAAMASQSPKKNAQSSVQFWVVISTAFVAIIAIASAILFSNRYQLIAAARTENAVVYRIDRLTGQVSLCWPRSCERVAEKKESDGDRSSTP
jgi:anti-sigma-K factor RskA